MLSRYWTQVWEAAEPDWWPRGSVPMTYRPEKKHRKSLLSAPIHHRWGLISDGEHTGWKRKEFWMTDVCVLHKQQLLCCLLWDTFLLSFIYLGDVCKAKIICLTFTVHTFKFSQISQGWDESVFMTWRDHQWFPLVVPLFRYSHIKLSVQCPKRGCDVTVTISVINKHRAEQSQTADATLE